MAKLEFYARPSELFRYRSLGFDQGTFSMTRLDREIEAIVEGYIYCPRFNQMNDPMEGFFESARSIRRRENYEEVVSQIRDRKVDMGIASLAEGWSNELMWAHYADGFRGICVAYSVDGLLQGFNDNCALARMQYLDRPYKLDLETLDQKDHVRAILATKNLKWMYEREWRLFSPVSGKIAHGRCRAHAVYLGSRMYPDHINQVTERLREVPGLEIIRTIVDGYDVKQAE